MEYLILDTKEEKNKDKVKIYKDYYSYSFHYNRSKKKKINLKGKDYLNSKKIKVSKFVYRKKKRKQKSNRKYKLRIPKRYTTYIKTHWWEKRKNEYYRLFTKRCCVCGSYKYISLHHLKYKNYGDEENKDLVPMCAYHHELFHELYGVKSDMHAEMQEFMEEYFKPF